MYTKRRGLQYFEIITESVYFVLVHFHYMIIQSIYSIGSIRAKSALVPFFSRVSANVPPKCCPFEKFHWTERAVKFPYALRIMSFGMNF